jgi:hypothetical protein
MVIEELTCIGGWMIGYMAVDDSFEHEFSTPKEALEYVFSEWISSYDGARVLDMSMKEFCAILRESEIGKFARADGIGAADDTLEE